LVRLWLGDCARTADHLHAFRPADRALRNVVTHGQVIAAIQQLRPPQVHLFFAAPQGAALMLGHHWNLLPRTTVYEHLGTTYAPAMTIS
jgi:hypothetical protein